MPMRDQPEGVHRVRRPGAVRAYDISVDGEYAGWVEMLPKQQCRAYRDGTWPRVFGRPAGYLQAVSWLAEAHRAARKTAEPVTAAEAAGVAPLSPVAEDPFRGEAFADPLA